MLILTFAVIVTLFGFAPTGLLSVVHGLWAWSDQRRGDTEKANQRRRDALRWCWISVAIGVMVELPVAATLLANGLWG